MAELSKRRFTILDAMILVGAIAPSAATVRFHYEWLAQTRIYDWLALTGILGSATIPTQNLVQIVLQTSGLFCAFALTVLWFLPPRPRWRRLGRLPGFIASVVPIPVVLSKGLFVLDRSTTPHSRGSLSGTIGFERFYVLFTGNPHTFALMVATGWATLALSGRWCPEPSWLDRAGRGLGVFWIGWVLVEHVVRWIWG